MLEAANRGVRTNKVLLVFPYPTVVMPPIITIISTTSHQNQHNILSCFHPSHTVSILASNVKDFLSGQLISLIVPSLSFRNCLAVHMNEDNKRLCDNALI